MTKTELNKKVSDNMKETKEALQTVIDELNQGQRKKMLKSEKVKALFDRYGVVTGEA